MNFDAVRTVSTEQPNSIGQMRNVTLADANGAIVATIPGHIALAIARIVIACVPSHALPGTISTNATAPLPSS